LVLLAVEFSSAVQVSETWGMLLVASLWVPAFAREGVLEEKIPRQETSQRMSSMAKTAE
jgi:hypothetical protein